MIRSHRTPSFNPQLLPGAAPTPALPPQGPLATPSPVAQASGDPAVPLAAQQFFNPLPAAPERCWLLLHAACQAAPDRDQEPLQSLYRRALEERRHAQGPGAPPDFEREMADTALRAAAVGGGASALRSMLLAQPLLRALCRLRLSQQPQQEHERFMSPRVSPQGGAAPQTTCTGRANAVALVCHYASGAVGAPRAHLANVFFQTFFRPLFAAYASGGLEALERAMIYLSCCEGAEHAAFIAFGPLSPSGCQSGPDRPARHGPRRPGPSLAARPAPRPEARGPRPEVLAAPAARARPRPIAPAPPLPAQRRPQGAFAAPQVLAEAQSLL